MIRTSARYGRLPAFPLAQMKATRAQLESEGVDVIDLGAGDSGLPPPPAAVSRLREVSEDPTYSSYPFQRGLPEFREAVSRWMKRRFGLDVDPWTEVLPLIGSKDGIAHMPFAFMDPGEVGIIPDPGYTPYVGGVTLAGGEPHLVPLRPEHDFLIPLSEVPDDVAARTRILYLNYPNNPTTAVAPDAYYREAIDFCRERGALLAHDHAYSELAFDGYRPSSVLEFDGAGEVALEFHSLSKTYNMTGWRLGWAVGRPELIAALQTVKTFVDTGQFLAVQAAGAAALDAWDTWVPGNVATFQRRRDALVEALRRAGFDVALPRATMYVWVPLPEGIGSSEEFARQALEEQGVMVLPGATLGKGGEGFFRAALTASEDRLAEAGRRLGALL
ncbi:MAG: aminotransferase class I/II-fold pyridoxal phosphate-dependent enzyme [Gemmatimonadota bacterium]|nr:aminotransferase class I/II-fold pyridoxal phosphate-dependent enzyme [Gemmatimonadota bacterium]